jgi:hypothetical protein
MCRKEYNDEKEIEAFARDVAVEPVDDVQRNVPGIIALLYRRFVAPPKDEGGMPPFSKRTPADIATWRRTAGIRTRS